MSALPSRPLLTDYEAVLLAHEVEAWMDYLAMTSARKDAKYLRIEEIAWRKLQQRLARVQEQRVMAQNLIFE